jgi:aspartate/methionine/tyrosine aminotransferase
MSTPGPIHPQLAQGDYPFTSLEARSRELCPPGVDPIYFSIGDPREETPDFIRQALRDAVPVVSSYPTVVGSRHCAARAPDGSSAASA